MKVIDVKMDRNVCLQILSKIFVNEEYELIDWKLERFEEHVGYHGTHSRLSIKVSRSNTTSTLRFFVKSATENQEIFDQYWKQVRCFEKEYYMLDRIIGELEEAVGEKLAPKCFLNVLDKFVVLEDLAEHGYNSEKVKSKDLKYVWKTLEKIAVFHSASFIIENKFGKKIQDVFPQINFENLLINGNKEGYVFYASNRIVHNLIKSRLNDIPLQFKDHFMNWYIATMGKLVKPSTKYRNVVCHGDPWFMNFMYKCKENGDFEDVLMVDFQFSRIVPPALEIQQYLSLIFDLETLRSMKETVIDIYYSKMKQTLSKAGINISLVLPKEHLNESFDLYQPFGFIANTVYKSIVSIPPKYSKEMTPDDFIELMTVGNLKITEEAYEQDETYRKTMTNTIMDCYKLFSECH